MVIEKNQVGIEAKVEGEGNKKRQQQKKYMRSVIVLNQVVGPVMCKLGLQAMMAARVQRVAVSGVVGVAVSRMMRCNQNGWRRRSTTFDQQHKMASPGEEKKSNTEDKTERRRSKTLSPPGPFSFSPGVASESITITNQLLIR